MHARSSVVLVALAASFVACSGSKTEGEPPIDTDASTDSAGDSAGDSAAETDAAEVGPTGTCADFDPYKRPLFGDLHDHTSYSLDAWGVGNPNQGPAEAYAFAAGQPVKLADGSTVKLDRPLDFMAVTDHSEFFDVIGQCTLTDASGKLDQSVYCKTFRSGGFDPGSPATLRFVELVNPKPVDSVTCKTGDCTAYRKDVWARTIAATKAANDPCKMTTFNAYEYTGNTSNKNIHRNVIFRNENVVQFPLDYIHYPSVGEMLAAFDKECLPANGCDAVLIPHSPNDSQGEKWLVASTAEGVLRGKWERLAEIYQHKGASECLNPTTDPSDVGYDPSCEFELSTVLNGQPDRSKDPPGYVRAGLSKGIEAYASTKANPLQLGIIASTDTHNTTPGGTEEDVWRGHTGTGDDTPTERLTAPTAPGTNPQYFSPGGLAAVWAEENTRESIFLALKRRETFGTSGVRMAVRFYMTWSKDDFCKDPRFPKSLVDGGGIPMGGSFDGKGHAGEKPRFVVFALKDKNNLQEIDLVRSIVKSGKAEEKVFRVMAKDSAVGDPMICATFDADAGYDAAAPSYWYARVLEVPSWRWSHYDCQKTSNSACAQLDKKINERAWTSPIWLLP